MRRRKTQVRMREPLMGGVPAASLTDTLTLNCSLSAWAGNPENCRWCNTTITATKRRTWCSDKCRRAFERNHVWRRARSAARRRAKRQCVTCGGTEKLEVNHIVPLIGAGYLASCFHHETNLELLCHSCHVEVTKQQRASRKEGKPE